MWNRQEAHAEPAPDHPPPSVEGQPGDGPRGPVQQGPAGSGSVPADHLLLPRADPHAASPGEPRPPGIKPHLLCGAMSDQNPNSVGSVSEELLQLWVREKHLRVKHHPVKIL